MNKSDILDELRLEVGQVLDHAKTLSEFYEGIVDKIGNRIDDNFAIGLFETQEKVFQLISSVGSLSVNAVERFGEGTLSVCAIRAEVTIYKTYKRNCTLSPFYEGHHLKGVLVIETPKKQYNLTDEDIAFVKEVTRFIEVNHVYYQ